MVKQIEGILSFTGGSVFIWAVIFFGWHGVLFVGVMVGLYYISDIVMVFCLVIAMLTYIVFNKCMGVSFDESMVIIKNKFNEKTMEQKNG